MKQKMLGLFLIIGSVVMGLLFVSITQPPTVVYGGTTAKAVPDNCLGPNGEVPAEYTNSGGHVAGSGANFGTVSVSQTGTKIEIDYVPQPPFTLPIVACVEVATVTEVIDWHPAERPGAVIDEPSGVIIDTAVSAYPVNKSASSDSAVSSVQSVETVWMVWGEAPYSVYIPITQ